MNTAHMYPSDLSFEGDEKKIPESEVEVYEWLEKLPEDYHIFHSVSFSKMTPNNFVTNYENDFVIVHPQYGILVLEVKGGWISFVDGVIRQKNSKTGEVNILYGNKDPYKQATNAINDVYLPIFQERLGSKKPFLCVAVCFPGLSRNAIASSSFSLNYTTLEKFNALLFDDDIKKDPTERIKSIYHFAGSPSTTPMAPDDFRKVLDVLAGAMDFIGLSPEITGEIDRHFERLTREQEFLIDYIQEQKTATIQGAAGTGKTILANLAAERLADSGHKVLYVCFNRFLKEDLIERHPDSSVDYKDITTLASEVKTAIDDITTPEGRMSALYNKNPEDYPYQDVIIDEAQDLSDGEVEFLKEVVAKHRGVCYIFFDRNQILYPIDSIKWIASSECRLVLSRNCRNPQLIGQSSKSVLNQEVKVILMDLPGDKPLIRFEKDPKNFTLALYHLIKELKSDAHRLGNDDIAILTLKTEATSKLAGVSNLFGLPISSTKQAGKIWFTTARKFKGLERKGIIVIDIDESAFKDGEINNVFYVACSRATHCLRLLVAEDENRLSAIAETIGGITMKAEGKIQTKTKAGLFKDEENA